MVEDIKRILAKLQQMTVEELASYDVKLEDNVLQNYIYDDIAESLKWPQKPMGELDPWQRMCYYQVSDKTGTDCDVALFTVVVYYLAYGLGEKGWKINEHEGGYHLEKLGERWELRGDTMNSYATSVIGLLRKYFLTAYNGKLENEGILSDGYFVDKYQKFGKKPGDKIVWSAYILDKWNDFILLLKDAPVKNQISKDAVDEYIRLNHTIGNFIPVPFVKGGGQFNSPRGFGTPSKDYWDLALMCIYNHYSSVQDSIYNLKYPNYDLKWLLGKDQNVNLCRNWLDNFGSGLSGWDTFVEQNLMQDFVNHKQGHYGMPKELWEGHFTGRVMPKGEQYNDFFGKASARIKARDEKIAKKSKEELKDKDLTALAKTLVYG